VAPPKYIDVLGFKVFSDNLDLISVDNETAKVINTISPNSYGITTKDKVFDQALKNSDYLVLDGVYFALASILLKGKNIKRNQGPDVFNHFINKIITEKKRVFFLGSTAETLEKIKSKLTNNHPDIAIDCYSPPFKDEFTADDDLQMVEAVNNFNPDILFIGMTCPKQEKWAVAHKSDVKAGLIISIGNVFDWFAGNQKPIHPVWYKLRLGWLVRVFLRPEIFRRNIGNQMRFFADVLLLLLRIKKLQNA
jgi:N-acetylglucosaminyldiphosphoundecaprenol N-acetyl-beta-D-mannosaminyltransferase